MRLQTGFHPQWLQPMLIAAHVGLSVINSKVQYLGTYPWDLDLTRIELHHTVVFHWATHFCHQGNHHEKVKVNSSKVLST